MTGDVVNTASRLQTMAKPGTVLLGELTALAVTEAIQFEAVGALQLRGKAVPVRAFRAIGVRAEPSREHALGRPDLRSDASRSSGGWARRLPGLSEASPSDGSSSPRRAWASPVCWRSSLNGLRG